MNLKSLHLAKYANVGGSLHSTFTTAESSPPGPWTIELRPDLMGCIVSRAGANPGEVVTCWVPFSNCLNGYPSEVKKAAK